IKIPEGACFPTEFCVKTTNRFSGAALHFNLNHSDSDSMILKKAQIVRDNLDANRTVWLELSDEPWDFAFPWYIVMQHFSLPSHRLFPSGFGLEWNAMRTEQAAVIFRNVWTAAGRDPALIKTMLNVQFVVPGQTLNYLNFCATHDVNGNVVTAGDPTSIHIG